LVKKNYKVRRKLTFVEIAQHCFLLVFLPGTTKKSRTRGSLVEVVSGKGRMVNKGTKASSVELSIYEAEALV